MDAAFVHMNRADARGNGQYLGPDPYMDDLFLGAAERRFLSAERIVPTEDLAKEGPPQSLLISRLLVDGVIEAPNGAHFTSCDPDYPRDEAFQKQYAAVGQVARGVGRVPGGVARPQRGRLPGEAADAMEALVTPARRASWSGPTCASSPWRSASAATARSSPTRSAPSR